MVLFTLNNFTKDDGGTVRMRGILNALAQRNIEITLLSNAQNYTVFDDKINHIYLDCMIDKNQKRYIQTLLSISPKIFYSFIFKSLLSKITPKLQGYKEIIFFEYLDNSIGYLLKSQRVIDRYINDIHGIAPLEFKYKKRTLLNSIKSSIVSHLDKKVFYNGDAFWFLSRYIEEYYELLYPKIKKLENKIVPDGVNKELCFQSIDEVKMKKLYLKFDIKYNQTILFLGDFKDLGGVLDLIDAYNIVIKKIPDIKLILIGDGERFIEAQESVKRYNLEQNIIFVGRIEYNEIRTYQALATIIVCPDKEHIFSHLIPHIKYFDSLISGKIVINGAFKCIKDINEHQRYSINFEPSNIVDLADKIIYSFNNLDILESKYKNNKNIICNNFSYNHSIDSLL